MKKRIFEKRFFENKIFEKRKSILSAVLIASITLAAPFSGVRAENATSGDASPSSAVTSTQSGSEKVMRDNIFINGQDMSGVTFDEAIKKLGIDASYTDASVVLTSQFGDVETTLGDIGLQNNAEEVVAEAIDYGNHGNVLKRYKDIEALKTTPVEYEVKSTVDAVALDLIVEGKIGSEMAGDSSYSLDKHEDGTVKVIVEGQSVSVDAEATKSAIEDIINGDSYKGGKVSTKVVIADNSESEKMQQIARVKNLLGTYTTSYASSGAARKNNVQRAASLVDGHLLFPGEMISVYNSIAPIEVSNGYELAHAYVGTEVVDSAGGGVCQVATTLYNAALRAEIEIIQRNCHSMKVSYVPISADAAIAGGVLDLKLRNNLDAPIYIEALYDGANLSFNIWGEEYREEGRTIEFESIQTAVINPPSEPIYTEDKSLPAGTEEVTASAVTGYTGELWKYVYKNGERVESIKINSSKYQASAAKISFNGDPAEEEGEEDTAGDEDDNTGAPADGTADPNANADPNQQPADPNQQAAPVDPNQQVADPNQQPGTEAPQTTEAPAPTDPAATTP